MKREILNTHWNQRGSWAGGAAAICLLTSGTLASAQPADPPADPPAADEPTPPTDPPAEVEPAPPTEEEEGVDLTGAGPAGPPAGPAGPPPWAAQPQPPPYPYPYPPLPPEAADGEEEEEEDGEPHGGTQRNFGFGPRLGGLWAFGVGARAGHPYFGVDVSGGWQPMLPTVTPVGSDEGEMEFYHSWQLSMLGYVAFNPDSTFVAGATTGYSYNSIVGRGFVLAFEGIVSFSDNLGFQFHVGGGYYPDGEDRMREKKNIPAGSELGSTPDFQTALGVGLIIYP